MTKKAAASERPTTTDEDHADEDHVVTFDASCSCGAQVFGAWSGSELDAWAESHEHYEEEER